AYPSSSWSRTRSNRPRSSQQAELRQAARLGGMKSRWATRISKSARQVRQAMKRLYFPASILWPPQAGLFYLGILHECRDSEIGSSSLTGAELSIHHLAFPAAAPRPRPGSGARHLSLPCRHPRAAELIGDLSSEMMGTPTCTREIEAVAVTIAAGAVRFN